MTPYRIAVKKTIELSVIEWNDFTLAFNRVFKKQFTREYFEKKYLDSSLGFSLHGILYFETQIVGMFTAIPRKYIFKEQEITIALGCDAFILKEHRKDEFFLKQMSDVVFTQFTNYGFSYIISIPNKTAYLYWKYYGGWKDIGKLNYYIVPLRVSKLLGRFNFLDIFSFYFFKATISFVTFFSLLSRKYVEKTIHIKRDQEYFAHRYTSDYIFQELPDKGKFVYRIYQEDSIRTAYLIDCQPLSNSNIAIALNQIIKKTKGNIDIILFVGRIDNPPFFFLKVPSKREPREQPFIGFSNNPLNDTDFFLIDLWEVSLANFDNR